MLITLNLFYQIIFLSIPLNIREILNKFLFNIQNTEFWYHQILLLDRQKDKKLNKFFIDLIKEKDITPIYEKSNLINVFINYFNDLLFYKDWIIKFEYEIYNIINIK